MVPDASLLGARHIRTGLASLSSQTSFKKEMGTIRNKRSRVVNISCDNLFRNRPYINKFKSTVPSCIQYIYRPIRYVIVPSCIQYIYRSLGFVIVPSFIQYIYRYLRWFIVPSCIPYVYWSLSYVIEPSCIQYTYKSLGYVIVPSCIQYIYRSLRYVIVPLCIQYIYRSIRYVIVPSWIQYSYRSLWCVIVPSCIQYIYGSFRCSFKTFHAYNALKTPCVHLETLMHTQTIKFRPPDVHSYIHLWIQKNLYIKTIDM